MIIISHRGNDNDFPANNHPHLIEQSLAKHGWVEADVYLQDGYLWLGHDGPEYGMDDDWFVKHQNGLILHAKHGPAANYLSQTNLHWFGHDEDCFVATSKGWLWCYPDNPMFGGIVVHTGYSQQVLEKFRKLGVRGVCTDEPTKWRDALKTL